MRNKKASNIVLFNESLLGGASMHYEDLARIESKEIQWISRFRPQSMSDINYESLAA